MSEQAAGGRTGCRADQDASRANSHRSVAHACRQVLKPRGRNRGRRDEVAHAPAAHATVVAHGAPAGQSALRAAKPACRRCTPAAPPTRKILRGAPGDVGPGRLQFTHAADAQGAKRGGAKRVVPGAAHYAPTRWSSSGAPYTRAGARAKSGIPAVSFERAAMPSIRDRVEFGGGSISGTEGRTTAAEVLPKCHRTRLGPDPGLPHHVGRDRRASNSPRCDGDSPEGWLKRLPGRRWLLPYPTRSEYRAASSTPTAARA